MMDHKSQARRGLSNYLIFLIAIVGIHLFAFSCKPQIVWEHVDDLTSMKYLLARGDTLPEFISIDHEYVGKMGTWLLVKSFHGNVDEDTTITLALKVMVGIHEEIHIDPLNVGDIHVEPVEYAQFLHEVDSTGYASGFMEFFSDTAKYREKFGMIESLKIIKR